MNSFQILGITTQLDPDQHCTMGCSVAEELTLNPAIIWVTIVGTQSWQKIFAARHPSTDCCRPQDQERQQNELKNTANIYSVLFLYYVVASTEKVTSNIVGDWRDHAVRYSKNTTSSIGCNSSWPNRIYEHCTWLVLVKNRKQPVVVVVWKIFSDDWKTKSLASYHNLQEQKYENQVSG